MKVQTWEYVMSASLSVGKSAIRLRRMLMGSCLALTVGCAATPGPGEQLATAARSGDVATTRALVNKGIDINAGARDGQTALFVASVSDHPEVVRMLLNNGADIEATELSQGATALIAASLKGNREVVQLLLDRGANVEARTTTGLTALIMASRNANLDVVTVLLSKGANVNAQEIHGATGLMLAAYRDNYMMVSELLDNGADPNLANSEGGTALMAASTGDDMAVVQALLAKGANVNARNSRGMTALNAAKNTGIRDLLVRAGAGPWSLSVNLCAGHNERQGGVL